MKHNIKGIHHILDNMFKNNAMSMSWFQQVGWLYRWFWPWKEVIVYHIPPPFDLNGETRYLHNESQGFQLYIPLDFSNLLACGIIFWESICSFFYRLKHMLIDLNITIRLPNYTFR
jgi:hypothetical protein